MTELIPPKDKHYNREFFITITAFDEFNAPFSIDSKIFYRKYCNKKNLKDLISTLSKIKDIDLCGIAKPLNPFKKYLIKINDQPVGISTNTEDFLNQAFIEYINAFIKFTAFTKPPKERRLKNVN